jgi:hypothetical protein
VVDLVIDFFKFEDEGVFDVAGMGYLYFLFFFLLSIVWLLLTTVWDLLTTVWDLLLVDVHLLDLALFFFLLNQN